MPGAGPNLPATVKHYQVIRVLGRGGMGTVLEGADRRDGSRVAIKLLHPHLAASDPSYLDRFEREAHVAALLRSPYTVHLIDYGVEGDLYYIVMEFVEGESLAERLAGGPLFPEEALRIAGEVARALEEANARGIVHRDIKPENILLDDRGRVKVTDFGIARSTTGAGITVAGGFVGTPAYAAPEQVDGNVDHRSDIYSLGVTLYTALTGNPPFRGKTAMDTLFQHKSATVPMAPLAHLPDPVQNIVRRCLEKDPLDRYQSAADLAGAIDRARGALQRMPKPDPPPIATPTVVEARPTAVAPERPPAVPPARTGTGSQVRQAVPPPVVPVSAAPAASRPRPPNPPPWRRTPVVLTALAGLIGLGAFGGVLAVAALGGDDDDPPATPAATESPATATSSAVTATGTTPAQETPSPTAVAATPTPIGGFARIDGPIRIGANGAYQVAFITDGFDYGLPGTHVHFFFDSVSIEEAGLPGGDGSGWFVYGDGSPFTGYTIADRPPEARRMCILVANQDHSVREGTGNCVELPSE
jgi:serine/threonine-protein kinase